MLNRRHTLPIDSINKCVLSRATVQVVLTATLTTILWDTPTIIDNIFSYNAATGVLTCNQRGLFIVSLNTNWAVSAVGARENLVRVDDGVNNIIYVSTLTSTALVTGGNNIFSFNRKTEDVGNFTFQVLQNTGGNLNLGGNTNLRAEIYKVDDIG